MTQPRYAFASVWETNRPPVRLDAIPEAHRRNPMRQATLSITAARPKSICPFRKSRFAQGAKPRPGTPAR